MALEPEQLNTAVLFIIFNRPEKTRQSFAILKNIQPRRLYIAADGPRGEHDTKNVELARKIATTVDWNCEVKTLFHDKNLGCKHAVSSAINWLFANEEEGIILEDDCLPDQTFFRFCSELLEHYRNDERIYAISGTNLQRGRLKQLPESYYFSMYPQMWGWATWRRAWRHFDLNMKAWPKFKDKDRLFELFGAPEAHLWTDIFDKVTRDEISTWDYPWFLSCWINQGLTVTPKVNLVENIGFGPNAQATHTHWFERPYLVEREEMPFPLNHPQKVIRNFRADYYTWNNAYRPSFLKTTWRDRLNNLRPFPPKGRKA